MIFLIILIVLVISVTIGKNFMNKEGFIAFGYSTNPVDTISLTCYSSTKKVTKIQDNFYFDTTNGNLIELDGSAYTTANDPIGTTLTTLYVIPRGGDGVYQYDISNSGSVPTIQDVNIGTISSLESSYKSFIVKSISTTSASGSVIYIPWSLQTILVPILDTSSSKVINNAYLCQSSGVQSASITNISSLALTGVYTDSDTNNNKSVTESVYDSTRSVYQVSHYVKFDSTNGNLIIINDDTSGNKILVYDRYGKSVSTPIDSASNSTSIPNVSFSAWTILDIKGQNIVLYIANAKNTLISLIAMKNSTLTELTLKNVVRFTSAGKDVDGVIVSTSNTSSSSQSSSSSNVLSGYGTSGYGTSGYGTSGYRTGGNDSVVSEYFKWYWYWKNGPGANSSSQRNNDYILKTQIIPPVCPSCASCPSCSSSGTCTNCGGNGGSGTMTSSGVSIFDICGNPTSCSKLGYNGVGYDAKKNPIYCSQVLGQSQGQNQSQGQGQGQGQGLGLGFGQSQGPPNNSAGGVVNNAISTTGDVIGGTAMGAEAVIGGTVMGAGMLANNVIDKTTGLISGAGSGAVNLLKDTGSGVSNFLKGGSNGQGQSGYEQGQSGYGQGQAGYGTNNNQRSTYYGTQNQYSDQYSYNGMLPSKSTSNFMPITTDFSAFGK